jgi:hypothetical protein
LYIWLHSPNPRFLLLRNLECTPSCVACLPAQICLFGCFLPNLLPQHSNGFNPNHLQRLPAHISISGSLIAFSQTCRILMLQGKESKSFRRLPNHISIFCSVLPDLLLFVTTAAGFTPNRLRAQISVLGHPLPNLAFAGSAHSQLSRAFGLWVWGTCGGVGIWSVWGRIRNEYNQKSQRIDTDRSTKLVRAPFLIRSRHN